MSVLYIGKYFRRKSYDKPFVYVIIRTYDLILYFNCLNLKDKFPL